MEIVKPGTLIDSGLRQYTILLLLDWIRKAELTTIDDGDEFSVLLADGQKQTTRAIRTPKIAVSIGEFTWRESFQVIPKISGYDLALGKPWLSDINPEIIFKDNIMMLNDGTKKHNVVALDGRQWWNNSRAEKYGAYFIPTVEHEH